MKVYPVFDRTQQMKIELYLQSNNQRNYLLWILGTHTGLRISDILKIKVSDVQGDRLHILEQKTKKYKTIKLSAKLKQILSKYIDDHQLQTDNCLFFSRQSKGNPMSIRRVQQIVKQIGKCIGIEENINTHSMRKTFAYNLYQLSGNNIALVMEALNHSREYITLRYLCIRDKLLNEMIELL